MKSKSQLYQKAVEKWGTAPQLIMILEEMSELQKVICKWLRGNLDIKDVTTEQADLELMLEQLRFILKNDEAVEQEKENKLKRLSERLTNNEN